MTKQYFSPWLNWRYDLPAAIVVMLVALPLCLGIALASGAPLFSGLIAGVVGGVVIGALSKSPLSVSGPAAGLTVIVLSSIQSLPTFNAFLLAVCLAGTLQIAFGIMRAGVISEFIPTSVIKGMLAAIGIILILKQIQHAVGYDANATGPYDFWDKDGHNTFSSLWYMLQENLSLAATTISLVSLAFLFWWDKKQATYRNFLRLVPGPLVVVVFGVLANEAFKVFAPDYAISAEHLVAVPVVSSASEFFNNFTMPDFSLINDTQVWIIAFTLAAVASIESLLSIEAIDKLDPFKRTTPTNRELVAQGIGNIASGMIGGLPVTSVIVRSSANVSSGGRTQMSAILHGIMLFGLVVLIPQYLNYIPLSALAAVLISVGYKLTKPAIFIEKYRKGAAYYIPFVATIVAIVGTDLLIGILIGVAVGIVFIIRENVRSAIMVVENNGQWLVRFKKDMFFIHKHELNKALSELPDDCAVLIDISRANFIDKDNVEIINDFIASTAHRNIRVTLKRDHNDNLHSIMEPANATL